MEDVIRALNTGVLSTREGKEIGRTKLIRSFSNPKWEDKLILVRDQIETIRTRVEVAIREGELHVDSSSGSYCFYNRKLPDEIDLMRNTAISILNGVLEQTEIMSLREIRFKYR